MRTWFRRFLGRNPALLGMLMLGLPAVAMVAWIGVLADFATVSVAAITTAVALGFLVPVGLWFRGGIRRQQAAERQNAWAWPNVSNRPLLWAFGGILMAALVFALPILWLAALLGAVTLVQASLVTALAVAFQFGFMRLAARVADRQIEAEEKFKKDAIAEFGEEAEAQFRALEGDEHEADGK